MAIRGITRRDLDLVWRRIFQICGFTGSADDLAEAVAHGAAAATAGSTTADRTATCAAVTLARHQQFTAPAAPSTTAWSAQADAANGALTIAAQPDCPRKGQLKVTDANSSITAGSAAWIYVDGNGVSRTDTFDLSAQGTKIYTTTYAVARTTSITLSGLVGAQGGTDKVEAGPTAALGLPGAASPAGTYAVYKATVDGADEAVGTVDAVAGTLAPTTTPDGTKSFGAWYTCQVTPTQLAHSHIQS